MNELGVQGPVGFWDPLGFSSDGNAERLHRRQTELKHVGISMLATISYIAIEFKGKLPGYVFTLMGIKFTDMLQLCGFPRVPIAGRALIIAYGAFNGLSMDQSADFGFEVLTSFVSEQSKTKLSAELANGRLSIMALLVVLPGWPRRAGLDRLGAVHSSPRRAHENELGVQGCVLSLCRRIFAMDITALSYLKVKTVRLGFLEYASGYWVFYFVSELLPSQRAEAWRSGLRSKQ